MADELSWEELVGLSIKLRFELAELDSGYPFPLRLPRLAATPGDIRAFETEKGFALPNDFRKFLETCSGAMFGGYWVFGLEELRGSAMSCRADERLSVLQAEYEGELIDGAPFDFSGLAPVAALEGDTDVFLLDMRGDRGGQVWWFGAGQLVDKYSSFRVMVEAMVELLSKDVHELRAES